MEDASGGVSQDHIDFLPWAPTNGTDTFAYTCVNYDDYHHHLRPLPHTIYNN